MKLQWNFGDRVLNLPAAALSAGADAAQLHILLLCAAGEDAEAVYPPSAVKDALAFWRRAGVLAGEEEPEAKAAMARPAAIPAAEPEPKPAGKLARADEIPTYSAAELNGMMDRRRSLRVMVDEAQRICGKMFNVYEVNILIGLTDYLGLDEDYILLLLAHCMHIGKTGMRVIERYAISLVDGGVTTVPALEEHIRVREERHTLEGKVRAMFGMKSRSLTDSERKKIAAWMEYGYGEDVIRRAYEITVDTIHEPSMKYVHAILDRWHAEGLTDLGQIDRKLAEEREAKTAATGGNGSFNTDAFFEKALRRSFRKPEETNGGQA